MCSVTGMNKRSKSGSYSPAQLRGMRVVGSILRLTRESEPNYSSLRKFAKRVSTDEISFSAGDIRRYENAGYVVDTRYNTVASINPLYLQSISSFIPYPVPFLKELMELGLEPPEKKEMLSEWIRQKKEDLGSAFNRECQKWSLSEDELEQASKGFITSPLAMKLAGFLDLPVTDVFRGAIADRARVVDEEDEIDTGDGDN